MEKEAENYRKVCGDGISFDAITALKSIAFPIEYFEDAGAIKIDMFIYRLDDKEIHKIHIKEMCGRKRKAGIRPCKN